MLTELSYWREIASYERYLRRLDNKWQKKLAKAKKENQPGEAIYDLGWEWEQERRLNLHELLMLQHKKLAFQARKYVIATPDFDKEAGTWVESDILPGRWRWSPSVMEEIQNKVRDAQHKGRQTLLAAAALMTGLIGALTGLVSILIGIFP